MGKLCCLSTEKGGRQLAEFPLCVTAENLAALFTLFNQVTLPAATRVCEQKDDCSNSQGNLSEIMPLLTSYRNSVQIYHLASYIQAKSHFFVR